MDWHIPLIALIFILFDLLTGFLKAVKNKCVDSSVMRDGLFHKVGFIVAIALGYCCEYAVQYMDLGFQAPLVIPICIFICLTELVSILENLKQITPELGNVKFLEIFGDTDKGK